MSKSLTLKQNFVWTLLGNGIYAACQWGILVVLAKLGSPEMVGRFALGLAISAPVFMLANLQLRAIQATDARGEFGFGDYLGLRLITVGVALSIVSAIALLVGFATESAIAIVGVGLAKGFESISDVQYGLFQKRERMDRIAVSMVLRGSIGLGVLALAVRVTGDLIFGILALAAVWAMVALVFDRARVGGVLRAELPGNDSVRPRFHRTSLVRLLLLALPMGVVMLLLSLTANVPRYFVEWHHGESELGIFSAIAAIVVAGNMVITALGQTASPRLARFFADGDRRQFIWLLVRLLGIALALGAIAIAAALAVGRELLMFLYQAEYAAKSEILIVLMIAGSVQFLSGFLGVAATSMRMFKPQVVAHVVTVAITAAAALFLIGDLGLIGAAWTMVAGAATSMVSYAAIATWGVSRIGVAGAGEAGP